MIEVGLSPVDQSPSQSTNLQPSDGVASSCISSPSWKTSFVGVTVPPSGGDGVTSKVYVTVSVPQLIKKTNPSDYGFAISLGDLFLGRAFESESTEIDHQLFGSNYKISHVLMYYGKDFKELSEEQKKQDQLDDF